MPHWCLSILLLFLLQVYVNSLHVSSLEHDGAARRWNQREQSADRQARWTPGPHRPLCFHGVRDPPEAVLRMGGGQPDTFESDDDDPLASRVRHVPPRPDAEHAISATAALKRFLDRKRKPRATLLGLIIDSLIASQLLVVVQLLVDMLIAIPVLRLFSAFVLPMIRPMFQDFPMVGETSVVLAHWGIRLTKSLIAAVAAGFLFCCIASTNYLFQHPGIPVFYAAGMNLYSTWTFLEKISQDDQFKEHLSLPTIALRVLSCEVPGLFLYIWIALAGTWRGEGMKDVKRLWQQLLQGSARTDTQSGAYHAIRPGSSCWLDVNSGVQKRDRAGGRGTWAERTAAWVEKVEGEWRRAAQQARAEAMGDASPASTAARAGGSPACDLRPQTLQRRVPEEDLYRRTQDRTQGQGRTSAEGGSEGGAAKGGAFETARRGQAGGGGGLQGEGATREERQETAVGQQQGQGGKAVSKRRRANLKARAGGDGDRAAAAEGTVAGQAPKTRSCLEAEHKESGRGRRSARAMARDEDTESDSSSEEEEEAGKARGGLVGELKRRAGGVAKRLSVLGALGVVLRAGMSVVAASKRT